MLENLTISTLTGHLSNLGLNTSLTSIIAALTLILVGFSLNKLSNKWINKKVEVKDTSEHAEKTAKRVTAYLIYSLTLIAILGVFGVSASALGSVVGLIGLGLSFALRDIIANFVSGLLILLNKPFKINDQIEIEGESGTVKDIQIRATEMKTYDGRKVIIPNSKLYNDTVINNTAYDSRRFDVIVGISYDDDIEKAKDLAKETLDECKTVEAEPEPQVVVSELGGSSVDIKLRGWTVPSRASLVKASSEVTQKVKEKYDDNGLDIPYPIRTVFLNEE